MAKRYTINAGYQHRLRLRRILLLILFMFVIIAYSLFSYKSLICFELCSYESTLSHDRLTFDRHRFIEHYSEFVCPQNFRNLADWVYVSSNDIEVTTYGYFISYCLPAGSIIYVKTDSLPFFFRDSYPYLINNFVLITGQSDASSPGRFLSFLHDTNSKIIHWFGQNADIQSSQSNKFTPIPIGLNCHEMASAIRYVHQQYSNHTLPSVFSRPDEPQHYIHPRDITHQVFRLLIWQTLCRRSSSNLTFVTCIEKSDGANISNLLHIYTRNRQYPYWLSPRGNGLDCHRTWEALYLDVIPIVYDSTLSSLYLDLPIIVLNDTHEFNEHFLRTKLKEIAMKKMKSPSVYQMEKLRFSYWRRLILNKSRHSAENMKRGNQCWRAKMLTKTN
ncbi:hypothetical protein I4U23_004726 [Adineta vaga]|nr:hypothetical protein I4U23_004726 [Adineta vaga]